MQVTVMDEVRPSERIIEVRVPSFGGSPCHKDKLPVSLLQKSRRREELLGLLNVATGEKKTAKRPKEGREMFVTTKWCQ
jgi:hypothetical protein